MNKQMSLSGLRDELAQVRTKKKEFLEQIERIVPWGRWIAMIKPCYYKGERGNKPYDLELMLRLYLLQNLYNPVSYTHLPTSTASTSTRILLSIASATAAAKCFDRGRGRWQGYALSQMSFARRMDCLSFQDRKQRRKDLGQESTAPPPKVRAGSSGS